MAAVATVSQLARLKAGKRSPGVDLTRFTSSAEYDLGALAFAQASSKVYRYVKFLDAVTYAAGQWCYQASATAWNVTNDILTGTMTAGFNLAGVCLGVPTQNQYGWIQIAGHNADMVSDLPVIRGML